MWLIDTEKIHDLAVNIYNIKEECNKLKQLGVGVNCIERNIDRMLACLKMLELNICDPADVLRN